MASMTTADYLTQYSFKEALAQPGFSEKLNALIQWWPTSRLSRSIARYFGRDADLMASGLALTILVSLTAALTVSLTAFMAVLGSHDELRTSTFGVINEAFPGLLDTPSSEGLVNPEVFVADSAFSLTSTIAFLVMTWTGLSVVGRLGNAIRMIFGIAVTPEPFQKTLARNAAGALGLALSLILASGLGIVTDLFSVQIFGYFGLEESFLSSALIAVTSYAVPFFVNIWVAWLLIRVVAGVRVPFTDLRQGLIMFSVIATLLRILGTGAVASVSGPVLTTATTLITLVLWINIQMRATLFTAAWMANPPRPFPLSSAEEMRFNQRPNYVTMSVPDTLRWSYHELTGNLSPQLTDDSIAELQFNTRPSKKGRTIFSWLFGRHELKNRD